MWNSLPNELRIAQHIRFSAKCYIPWTSLHVKRIQPLDKEIFRIVYKMSPDFNTDLINIKKSNYNLRKLETMELLRVSITRYGLKSFSLRGGPSVEQSA